MRWQKIATHAGTRKGKRAYAGRNRESQNGFSTTRTTIAIISTVGTSFIIRQ